MDKSARIRLYEPSDAKLVRFVIGKAALEPLTVANRRGYVHPIFLGIWFALSSAMAQLMNWWPSQGYSVLRWLAPLPAFATMAVPLMFGIDWLNRDGIEDRAQDILRRPDAVDFTNYYSKVSGSSLWLMEYGETLVGLVAIDARDKNENKHKRGRNGSRRGSPQATDAYIRHFYVDEPFRSTGIQEYLLAHAIRHTFNANPSINTIKAESNPLVPYMQKALRSAGFIQDKQLGSIGLLKWQIYEASLDRAQWKEEK